MPKEFAMTDDGDLMVDSGDAIDASYYPVPNDIYPASKRHIIQQIIISLRTTIRSFTIHSDIGHDIDRYIGRPNTLELKNAIQISVSRAVSRVSDDFVVRVVPLSVTRLGVFVYSIQPGLDFVFSFSYDLDEGFLIDQSNFVFG